MYIYLITIVTVLGISLTSVDKRIDRNFEFFFTIIFWLLLTTIAGTRLVGYDLDIYKIHFNSVPDITQYTRTDVSIEIGYELIVSIYKTFSDSFNGFLFLYAGLTLILAITVSYKYSPYPLLSIGMFFAYSFFYQVMGQMRQPFAIFFLYIFLIPLIQKRKNIQSCIIILLATFLFHKSCILCLGILIFKDKIISPPKIILFSGLTICTYIISSSIIDIILAIIPKSLFIYDALVAYTSTKAIQVGFTLGMLERIGMFGFLYYISYKYNLYQNNITLRVFINAYFTGICIYFSFISVAAEFATRGTFFYAYSLFFAAPILLKETTSKTQTFLYIIIMLWTIYIGTTLLKNQEEEYIPYNSTLFQS